MKILHLAPLSPYNIGWSYQDNLLPKYQRKLGHEVTVVVSPFENTPNGKVDVGEADFYLEDGVHVIRKRRLLGNGLFGKIISFTDVEKIIEKVHPDYIMVHGLMTLSIFQVIHYKKRKNPNCIIVQDNHLDENIGFKTNKLITNICYLYWKVINKYPQKYVDKYYGVTEWRREFLVKRFGIRESKTDVLIMGADLENVDFSMRTRYKKELSRKYKLDNQFVIVTGGKIEKNKNIADLMKAVKNIDGCKLIVFGTVADGYKKEIESSMNDNTIMIGWKNKEEIMNLFLCADLVSFLGQHSVLWEQACASKTPCLFRYWPGLEHLNVGGNCRFLKSIKIEMIEKELLEIKNRYYKKMDVVCKSNKTDVFSYLNIAKKSLLI